MTAVSHIAGFSLTTRDAAALAVFYERAFGCHRISSRRKSDPAFSRLMGVQGGADSIALRLGGQTIELLQFDAPGRPYPAAADAADLVFQHLAIVVREMTAAWDRLCAQGNWSPITRGTPQTLPPPAGGVTAFKFRDPEGHPLELLMFPPGGVPPQWRRTAPRQPCLGIDHSAISVADATISTAFYAGLGLRLDGRSENSGPEQERLDDIAAVRVGVRALLPPRPAPHLELLCYRGRPRREKPALRNNDIAASRLVFTADAALPRSLCDPDGHRLLFVPPSHTGDDFDA